MLAPSTYQAIAIDKRNDGVVFATLNRPDRLNAVNATMHHELSRITREFDGDPDRQGARADRRRAGVLRRRRLLPGARRRHGRRHDARGGPPDRRPPPGVSEAGHLGRQRLRHGPRRDRRPALRRRVRRRVGRVRRHPREDGHRRGRRRPGHLVAADGSQPGQVLPHDRRPRHRGGGRANGPRQLRRTGRDGRRRGAGAGGAARGRTWRGHLGVEDGHQQLHALGVEHRAAAIAQPGGRIDALGRPPRGRHRVQEKREPRFTGR